MPAFQEQDASKKAELLKNLVENGKTKFLSVFNRLANENLNNGGYLIGNSLTWADIMVVNCIEGIEKALNVQLLDGSLPALQKLRETVISAKGIKEWMAKRLVTKL